MRISQLAFLFVLLIPSAVIAKGTLIDNNPTGGHRSYWPAPGSYIGGTMWTIDADPMDIWSLPLTSTLPKGSYKLYILAGARNGSPSETQIEIGLGNMVIPARWKTSWSPRTPANLVDGKHIRRLNRLA